MLKKISIVLTLIASTYLAGCVSVPMATIEEDPARKEFSSPSQDIAGLYIFRNFHPSRQDLLLKKAIYLDDELMGKTLPNTYFYRELEPGQYKISTKSEFGKNDLTIEIEGGRNYFVRQYVKTGFFSAGAGIKRVLEEEGRKGVLKSKLAK